MRQCSKSKGPKPARLAEENLQFYERKLREVVVEEAVVVEVVVVALEIASKVKVTGKVKDHLAEEVEEDCNLKKS